MTHFVEFSKRCKRGMKNKGKNPKSKKWKRIGREKYLLQRIFLGHY